MSYILEALKKAERKQEQEESPKTLLFSAATIRKTSTRPLWLYPLIAVLLLNAGIMIWWLAPWRSIREVSLPTASITIPPPKESDSSATNHRDQTGSRATEAVRLNEPEVKPSPPKAAQEPSKAPPREAREIPGPSSLGSREPRDVAASPAARPAPAGTVSPEPKISVNRTPPGTQRVYALNELPAAVRNGLPEFRITGHAFSPEPQTRVVRINDRILQEGQDLSPGLKLEEIVPGGVILSYEGYHFRVNTGVNP